jgi:hypothetical protein
MDNITAGNTKKGLEQRISTASLGVIFIWVGAAYMVEAGVGPALIGVGAIALLAQLVRVIKGFNLERFWIITGIVCALGGAWELYYSKVPLVPVLLIAIGIVMLLPIITGKQIFRRKKH